MEQYQNLLREILDKGDAKPPAREGQVPTQSRFGTMMRFNLADGFPLMTTKKMHYKGIFTELLWFLKGDTNIKYLVDNGCNIWNKDAYRWYLKHEEEFGNPARMDFSIEHFIQALKNRGGDEMKRKEFLGSDYVLGDLGKVYGHTWRNHNIDQVQYIIDSINGNPFSRYHILDAWDLSIKDEQALPPCHLLYQFNGVERNGVMHLDLLLFQRSADTILGVPYNIASAAALLKIIAEVTGMVPGELVWVGGDTHLYDNHTEAIEEVLARTPKKLPKLNLCRSVSSLEDIEKLTPADFAILGYESHPPIKAELNVGK